MQHPFSFKNIFPDIAAWILITLFVYAASSKIADFQKFSIQLGQSPLLTSMRHLVAWIIPTIEFIIALMLAFSKTRLKAFYASYTLMVVFTLYIIAITRFSDYVPCSCGGILQHMTWNQHLIFNLFILAITLAGIILSNNKQDIFIAIKSGETENL
ncbi:MAG TPA: MauE/DoxX family redox-associated membrane protein [Puia sp.]|jgi:hypothetical protein|nr:MauE/DoxX family redox-associated membrane protein [Puia sp.]